MGIIPSALKSRNEFANSSSSPDRNDKDKVTLPDEEVEKFATTPLKGLKLASSDDTSKEMTDSNVKKNLFTANASPVPSPRKSKANTPLLNKDSPAKGTTKEHIFGEW